MFVSSRLSVVLSLILIGGLSACGGGDSSSNQQDDNPTLSDNSGIVAQFVDQPLVSVIYPELCIANSTDNIPVLETCDLTNDRHLWTYNGQNQVVNAETGLCFVNYQNLWLNLGYCQDSAAQYWTLEEQQFTQRGYSIDVNTDNLDLLVYSQHGGINQRWVIPTVAHDELAASDLLSVTYPIDISNTNELEAEMYIDILNRLTPIDTDYPYFRDISSYPGDVGPNQNRVTKKIEIVRTHYDLYDFDVPIRKFWTDTGIYLPANEVQRIDISSDFDSVEGLYAIINLHTDVLDRYSYNVELDGVLKRFGNVTTRIPLNKGVNYVRSQYGGSLVIESDINDGDTIEAEIFDAVEGIYFKLGEHNLEQWRAMLEKDVPWGTLEGNKIVLNIQKDHLTQIENPETLLKLFDDGADWIHDLAGLEDQPDNDVHRKPTVKDRFVEDEQIWAGFAHAGYPIMTSPGWNLYDADFVKTQGWGNWHEIGHNYQMGCLWSDPFGVESSVNTFTMYVEEKLGNSSRLVREQRYSAAIAKLNDDFDFENDAGVWDKLVFLMQLKHAFPDVGWDLYRQLNRQYRELPTSEIEFICNSNFNSYGKTYELMSKITGHDLAQHFTRWGIQLDQHYLDEVRLLNLPQPSINISEINPEN